MPINKITSSKRGKAAIVAVMASAIAGAVAMMPNGTPASVQLSVDRLIKPWEGLHTSAYLDIVKVPTICYGETKGIRVGMKKTVQQCESMLIERVTNDYYRPLTKCISNFTKMPIGVQAAMISGAYNFGVGGMCGSRVAKLHMQGQYRAGCEAQTAWNKAGGRVVNGLVKRREMGDAQRIGEAEICVSGL